ncbi:MAG: phosphatase PAP2 family protein [Bernardetiaceae bacterium]|jgi:undecaprenyl-diphosphatase|nr:phosphatase PAP2 family protein [Bernardetiaceae bacterium]
MLEQLRQFDLELFLWLNQWHQPWLDPVMRFITDTDSWVPLYLLLVGWFIWRFKRRALAVVIVVALTITAADQFASGLMKPLVGRLRPCHERTVAPKVHLIKGCGGRFGFVSSHAANTFALATLLWLLSRGLPERGKLGAFMFSWASVVTYSRIYAGVHYPADVLGGALAGAAIAWLLVSLAQLAKVAPFYRPGIPA